MTETGDQDHSGGEIAHIENSLSLLPWQRQLQQHLDESTYHYPNDYHIIWIYSPNGAIEKSQFIHYMTRFHEVCTMVPEDEKDLMDQIDTVRDKEVYLIDMPREPPQEGMFYHLLKGLKNGLLCHACHGTVLQFTMDNSHVVCFADYLPDVDLVSPSRYQVWTIEDRQATPQKKTLEELRNHIMHT
jgi:hypothetical protein